MVGEGWGGQVEEGRLGRQCPLSTAFPQLSMLRISPSLGHPLEPKLALQHLLFLLEYCMVTGYDWWDILLHVQPGMVQSLVERLHEEYTRQKPALQQVGLTRKRPSYCLPSVGLWVGPRAWQAPCSARQSVILGSSSNHPFILIPPSSEVCLHCSSVELVKGGHHGTTWAARGLDH